MSVSLNLPIRFFAKAQSWAYTLRFDHLTEEELNEKEKQKIAVAYHNRSVGIEDDMARRVPQELNPATYMMSLV